MNQNLSKSQSQLYQIHTLLRGQVESYNKHYHKGNNTSVSVELARELMDSIRYTLPYGTGTDAKAALLSGQAVLQGLLEAAKRKWLLVQGTMADVDSDFFRESVLSLGMWLESYDYLHFAARTPELPDYPLLKNPEPLPEGIGGAQALLQCFWYENQILCALENAPVQELLQRAVPDFYGVPVNLCEQPMFNAAGRAMLELKPLELEINDEQRRILLRKLRSISGEERKLLVTLSMEAVCAALALPDAGAACYARSAADHLLPRLEAALIGGSLEYVFV